MSILAVQLNHPGREKPFRLGDGYRHDQGLLIREWNNDPSHYRKFLQQKGSYIRKVGEPAQTADLLFWGEWEGNSLFQPFHTWNPNGIHKPFHSMHIRGHQNTDPYVFGDRFHYAVCKQRGRLTQLDPGSLILFGSSFKTGFALDTVFVVGEYESVHEVAASSARNYSKIYRKVTIEQLGNTYQSPDPKSNLRLYSGRMYKKHRDYFSYVPCRPLDADSSKGFQRLTFSYDNEALDFSANPTGIKILGEGMENVKNIWDTVLNHSFKEQFFPAVVLDEPGALL